MIACGVEGDKGEQISEQPKLFATYTTMFGLLSFIIFAFGIAYYTGTLTIPKMFAVFCISFVGFVFSFSMLYLTETAKGDKL